ncbi:tRNA (guanosine(37)-N1)-methyltransferase TrmD [endosymbiont GvMRE of Glomus versiforme]|uniref:tRNA (guanosine(37)-N1)-methyltransferase TrmD n=1 Tax=endosymbiont GvMRE of Glomus versiforme TaxID=2039283 RepID=UPI000EBE5572|nr:tRNA (guanosine(37)-N1)-methyltransferase TrmD [endosymbiont GvMRE of Glomus versiforme]RHZ37225.1 tRNA (guanine-N(1)-)-methyltransferase [endosymbiont GvMRE of Glomus versiforme]
MNHNFIYLTLFPQTFHAYFQISMAKRALQKGCLNYQVYNIRNWATRKQADDYIYGGGPGMLLKIDCLVKTLAAVYENYGKNCYVILLSPQGKRFTQKDVKRLNQNKNLVFLCGHYEGFDERILNYIDEQISVGDFITSGGEIPALLITEVLIRALPGVLSTEVYQNETFQTENFFDFAAYTRPAIFEGQEVPAVLLSGNHQKIQEWRKENSQQKAQKQGQGPFNQQKIIPQANKWRLALITKNEK